MESSSTHDTEAGHSVRKRRSRFDEDDIMEDNTDDNPSKKRRCTNALAINVGWQPSYEFVNRESEPKAEGYQLNRLLSPTSINSDTSSTTKRQKWSRNIYPSSPTDSGYTNIASSPASSDNHWPITKQLSFDFLSSTLQSTALRKDKLMNCPVSPESSSWIETSYPHPQSISSGIGTDQSDCGTPFPLIFSPTRCTFQNGKDVSFDGKQLGNSESSQMNHFHAETKLNLNRILKKHFLTFKEELDYNICDHLFENDILKLKDVDDIKSAPRRQEKVEVLIKALAAPDLKSDTEVITNIIEALTVVKCEHLIDYFKKETEEHEETSIVPSQTFDMDHIFNIHRKTIEEEVEPRLFIDDLVVAGVLDLDEHEDIKTTDFKPNRMHCLIEYIKRKSKNSSQLFHRFCDKMLLKYPRLRTTLVQKAESPKTDGMQINTCLTGRLLVSEKKGNGNNQCSVKFNLIGEARKLEHMIVDDNNERPSEELAEEAMEVGCFEVMKTTLSSVKINLKCLSETGRLKFLKMCNENPKCLEKWLRCSLSAKYIEELQALGTNKSSFEICVELPARSEVVCACKLSKRAIVDHFTYMETNLKDVEHIVQAFVKYGLLTTEEAKEISVIPECQPNRFLMKVLNLDQDVEAHGLVNTKKKKKSHGLCLLEKHLRQTGQDSILAKLMLSKTKDTDVVKIEVKHIKQHYDFLLEELEPKHFLESLETLPKSEKIVEQIMATEIRRDRCKVMLDFIIEEGKLSKSITDWFVTELQRNGLSPIIDCIKPINTLEKGTKKKKKKTVDTSDHNLQESIMSVYKTILNEVEPKDMRSIFVKQKAMRATQFDAVCKHQSRRTRTVWFMKEVLKGDTSVLSCFLQALEQTGYHHIAARIKEDQVKSKDCPRLSPEISEEGKTISIKGEFELTYKHGTGDNDAYRLQEQTDMIDSSHFANVIQWLVTQQVGTEKNRKRTSSHSDDEPASLLPSKKQRLVVKAVAPSPEMSDLEDDEQHSTLKTYDESTNDDGIGSSISNSSKSTLGNDGFKDFSSVIFTDDDSSTEVHFIKEVVNDVVNAVTNTDKTSCSVEKELQIRTFDLSESITFT